MLLDQPSEKKKIQVSGNQQLLKGTIFAVVSLLWFSFLLCFVDMDWGKFSPMGPFSVEHNNREDYIFYLTCFSFFICMLVFTTVFYRNNLQPSDLLLRFGITLLVFVIIYLLQQFFILIFAPQKEIMLRGIALLPQSNMMLQVANIMLTFLFLYFLFAAVILFFSTVFFNGFFGLAGYVLCFFITAVFYLALYAISDLEEKLVLTRYPVGDIVLILFFSLVSFGIGVSSGQEEKKKRVTRSLSQLGKFDI